MKFFSCHGLRIVCHLGLSRQQLHIVDLQTGMTRGHQSVYDKGLKIFHERTKKLKVNEQEIEKERMQTTISYKFEEAKVKEDLIKMYRDRKRFAKEAQNHQLPSLNREKTSLGWTRKEKQRLLRHYSTERSDELFPAITCTEANVPRIMKRSISKESQYHDWLIGFPKVKDSTGKRTLRNGRLAKSGSWDNNSDMGAIKKHSKVANIVFNVPLTLRLTDTKIAAERHYEATIPRQRKYAVFLAASESGKHKRQPKLKRAVTKL